MDTTIYLNANMSSVVTRKKVYVKDVAEVFCQDKKIKNHVENLVLTEVPDEKQYKEVFSTCYLIEKILMNHRECQVESIGETEFIVFYQPVDDKRKLKDKVKLVLVSLISFFGAAFSIMTFNVDVTMPELFDEIYVLFMGVKPDGPGVLQAAYSIGIFFGVILFFNHGGRYKLTNDPSPLQVQMRDYEKEVDQAFIVGADRNQESVVE
ncbi:MAG: stage V sporulation protein AA [Lachnospiraceae bacterium]|nr:stage V sporulation protein AA [Lachnospiraceae bacterium]